MSDLSAWLSSSPLPPAAPTLSAWWDSVRPAREAFSKPVERAVASALFADRLAYAFSAGYQAALGALFPRLGQHEIAALCATEAGGAHPRAIQARLVPQGEGWSLTGAKRWTTGASFASTLFVVASTGVGADGRNQLRVARVSAKAPGVRFTPMDDLPFVPELPHASVDFEGVAVTEVLEGDGYTKYLKPFRTVEDIHVHAAVLGYLFGVGRRAGWELGKLSALIATAVELGQLPFDAPQTHLKLGDFIADSRAVIDGLDFARMEPAERERWERDRALLHVAEKARVKRLELAREWASRST